MNEKNYSVYCHIFPNGKRYVGITKNIRKRWQNGSGYVKQSYMHNAILKYGWNNIRHEILCEGLTQEQACEMEMMLISKYKSDNPQFGYNRSKGGENHFGGRFYSEEEREYRRKLMLGNTYCVGYKHSDETRKRMSEAQLRREHRPLTEEQIAKCIANLPPARRGVDNPISKAVLCIETGVVYSCGREAAEKLGLQRSHLSQVCNGKRNHTGGYHFRFYNENEEVFAN